MVLAAGDEATADLDAETADDFIAHGVLRGEAFAELAGESTGGGDAELAGIGAGAGGDVDDGFGDGGREVRFVQFGVDRGEIGIADPAENEVLFDRSADGFFDVFAGKVGDFAELRAGDIAERKRDGDGGVAFLSLLIDVDALPLVESFWSDRLDLEQRGRLEGVFLMGVSVFEVAGPAGIVLEAGAFFADDTAEL